MDNLLMSQLQSAQQNLESSLMNVCRSKLSFSDDLFDYYRNILVTVDSLFTEVFFSEVEWLRDFEINYYRKTLDLFHSFLDACEVLRSYNVACSITRSIADRMGVISFFLTCVDSDEKELRCLLYLLDSLDDALNLQMDGDVLMNNFSSKDFLGERESFLKNRIESCQELISKNKLILEKRYSLAKVFKHKNWKYKNSPEVLKPQYSWGELYDLIPYNKIPDISKHYKWLSQNVHGLYASTLDNPKDLPSSYYVPIVYSLNLLICFRSMVEDKMKR